MPRGHVTEIQRKRMLAAAVETVAEVGYARMTVAQVIGRARVSRKTFYDVFADREDCFLAVFEDAVARARSLIREAYASEPAWREAIRAGLGRLLVLMDDEPALARVCVVEALGAGDRVMLSRAEVLAELVAEVDRGRAGFRGSRAPSELTGEAAVGAVLAILHTRLLARDQRPLASLLGELMSIIVLPYLGARAATRELERPLGRGRAGGGDGLPGRARHRAAASDASNGAISDGRDPLRGINMRLTYRTLRVLAVVGEHPGASNREIAERSGIADQGQISKLLTRLARLGLIVNNGEGQERGAANAWQLTTRGEQLEQAARPR
ncbi:MAG TPA: TetR family transcriptional regulator [Solirubrobacteraceae bacterium]|nr:TetR family transcriptional regulator [Solirubrobacteraceae bacterium]